MMRFGRVADGVIVEMIDAEPFEVDAGVVPGFLSEQRLPPQPPEDAEGWELPPIEEWPVASSEIVRLFPADLDWRAVSSDVELGWIVDGNEIVAPSSPAMSKESLITYANAAQWRKATGGTMVIIGGQEVPFATSLNAMILINGTVVDLQISGGPSSVNWQVGVTTFVTIPKDEFIVAARAVKCFVQATFDALPAIFAGIDDGSITTADQIDAAIAV